LDTYPPTLAALQRKKVTLKKSSSTAALLWKSSYIWPSLFDDHLSHSIDMAQMIDAVVAWTEQSLSTHFR
jgi:hypothetical protein